MDKVKVVIPFDTGEQIRDVTIIGNGFGVLENSGAFTVTDTVSGYAVSRGFDLEKYAIGCAKALALETTADVLRTLAYKANARIELRTHEEFELLDVVNTILNEWRLLELENAVNGVDE